jgi:hypothetical protein
MWRWGVSGLLTLLGLWVASSAAYSGAWLYGRVFLCLPPPNLQHGATDAGQLPQCTDKPYELTAMATVLVAIWFLLWWFARFRFRKSARNPLLWRLPLIAFALFLPFAAWWGWDRYTHYF